MLEPINCTRYQLLLVLCLFIVVHRKAVVVLWLSRRHHKCKDGGSIPPANIYGSPTSLLGLLELVARELPNVTYS